MQLQDLLRELLATHKDLGRQLDELEAKWTGNHGGIARRNRVIDSINVSSAPGATAAMES